MLNMLPDHHAIMFVAKDRFGTSLPPEVTNAGNDVRVFSEKTLSIATVRDLIKASSLRPVTETTLTILVEANSIAFEAQHALLKVLEDPPGASRFIFVLTSTQNLLPTLRSRVMMVDEDAQSSEQETLREFLKLSAGKRLQLIADRFKDKDIGWSEAVLRDAIKYLDKSPDHQPTELLVAKRARLLASEFQSLRGSSQKMLLEYLALSLPEQKT